MTAAGLFSATALADRSMDRSEPSRFRLRAQRLLRSVLHRAPSVPPLLTHLRHAHSTFAPSPDNEKALPPSGWKRLILSAICVDLR